MRYLLIGLLGYFIAFIFLYIVFAFCKGEMNVNYWSVNLRSAMAFMSLFGALLGIALYNQNEHNN